MKQKKILIISYSSLQSDPRVIRQIRTLGNNFELYTCGLSSSELPWEKEFIPFTINGWSMFKDTRFPLRWFIIACYIIPLRIITKIKLFHRLKLYNLYYWNLGNLDLEKKLKKYKFDLIISNDLNTLPLAISVAKKFKSKVFFDAHEYSPLELENDANWMRWESPYLTYLAKKYIPKADACITVGYEIAKKYLELTGISFEVVLNAPQYQEHIKPVSVNNNINFIHHGGAMKARNLHVMVECFLLLPINYHLHLLLTNSDPEYLVYLKDLSKDNNNIHFHDPVPTESIPDFINKFDVGLAYIPPVNFNYEYCLPNKFFEFIQARLMIVTGPSPEMAKITKKYNLGLVAEGFEAKNLVNLIEKITPDIVINYKNNVDIAAKELSATHSMNIFLSKIVKLCAE